MCVVTLYNNFIFGFSTIQETILSTNFDKWKLTDMPTHGRNFL